MSIKNLLANQYKYPLPAPLSFLSHVVDTNSITISPDTRYVFVTGIPPASNYGITDPIVQVALISTGFNKPDIQLAGYQNYNPVAGTLEILVNTITDATTRFFIFVTQKSEP